MKFALIISRPHEIQINLSRGAKLKKERERKRGRETANTCRIDVAQQPLIWVSYAQVYFSQVYWNSSDSQQLIFCSIISAHFTVDRKSDKTTGNVNSHVYLQNNLTTECIWILKCHLLAFNTKNSKLFGWDVIMFSLRWPDYWLWSLFCPELSN